MTMQGVSHVLRASCTRRRLLQATMMLSLTSLPLDLFSSQAKRIDLSTAETSIAVEAGLEAPKLAEIRLRNADQSVDRWLNQVAEPLIDHAYIGEASHTLHWRLQPSAGSASAEAISLVYETGSETEAPHLRLSWEWRHRAAYGPIEHSIHIENLGHEEVWLPLQPSFRFDWQVDAKERLQRLWLEKGAGTPTIFGTHLDDLHDGDSWTGKSSSYDRQLDDRTREMIPYLLVDRAEGSRTGWYMGIEFSGRTHITLERKSNSVRGEAGLNPDPGPFRTRVMPGSSFDPPTVLLGAFHGGPDGAANVLRRWIRQVLNNPLTVQNPSYPFTNSNTWGEGTEINETQSYRMMDEATKLGLEMFHIDAGWFRGVGDWYPSQSKFQHGLAPIAEEAHRRGLKFGIWVDWAQAGVETEPGALNVNNPKIKDWLVADVPEGWKPYPFVGRTMDIGVPAVKNYAQAEIERLVTDNHLDMLEHDGYLVPYNCSRQDHPHAPLSKAPKSAIVEDTGLSMPDAENSTDVSYHAVRAYYEIYAHTRKQHPELLFEVCNDGGRMVDFGSAAHADYFSITDTYDPLSNRRAFYDASYIFPPAMLEAYVDRWPTPRMENFRYMLRSGMMGWFSLMFDPALAGNPNTLSDARLTTIAKWTPEDFAAAHEEIALYKEKLRPLIREADLYHLSARPDGVHWDGMEYYDAKTRRGVLFAFHGTAEEQKTHHFVLQGLDSERQYRVSFHDRGAAGEIVIPGYVLMQTGLEVSLPIPLSSELVFLEEVQ